MARSHDLQLAAVVMHRAPRPPRVSQLARWISTEQLAIQRSILAAASARDAETILRILEQDRLSPVNVATAAHRLAKVAKKGLRERSVQQLQAGMGWSWRVDVFVFCFWWVFQYLRHIFIGNHGV